VRGFCDAAAGGDVRLGRFDGGEWCLCWIRYSWIDIDMLLGFGVKLISTAGEFNYMTGFVYDIVLAINMVDDY